MTITDFTQYLLMKIVIILFIYLHLFYGIKFHFKNIFGKEYHI